jgi:hypothetical protein
VDPKKNRIVGDHWAQELITETKGKTGPSKQAQKILRSTNHMNANMISSSQVILPLKDTIAGYGQII